MTFLHTIFLAALAAAAIPLLLHLLNRQRLPLIRFSTLEFLKRLQKKRSRRIKLRQIILLIIRTLAVITLVMVFARPALKSGDTGGSAAAVEMVVIVDDAICSGAETRDGEIIRLISQKVGSLVEILNTYDRMTLISLSNPSRKVTITGGTKDILTEYLAEMKNSLRAPEILAAANTADSILANSGLFNRELYVVSPFYSSSWDTTVVLDYPDNMRCFLLPVGPAELENTSVDRINVAGSIFQRGKPVEIEAFFSNNSRRAVKDLLTSVYLNGERVAQASLDISADNSTSHTYTLIPDRTGKLEGYIKIEDTDPLSVDNRRYFLLNIPDSIRVMAVTPDVSTRRIIQAVMGVDPAGFIRLDWVDPVGWETSSFNGYNAVFLAGISSISPGASQRLAEYVEQGGGLVMTQGRNADLPALSRGFLHDMNIKPARGVKQNSEVAWGNFDLNHPFFTDIFENKASPRSPRFNFIVEISPDRGDEVIIPFSDGNPFLMEHHFDKGKVLLYAVPVDGLSEYFIFSGIFAPLMFRSVGYVCSDSNHGFNLISGTPSQVILSLGDALTAILELPDGNTMDLPPHPVMGGVSYHLPGMDQTGFYSITANNKVAASMTVNIPAGYSNLRRMEMRKLAEGFGGARILEDKDNIEQSIYAIRFGREIWQPLAIVFIVLLLSESLIGRPWRRNIN